MNICSKVVPNPCVVVPNTVTTNKSIPKILIVTPTQHETVHMMTTKRVFKLFEIDSHKIISNTEDIDAYNQVSVKDICYYADQNEYSAIMCYDNRSTETIDSIAQSTIIPTIYIGNYLKPIIGNPVVIFSEDSSINAAIFLVQMLSLKYDSVMNKLQKMKLTK